MHDSTKRVIDKLDELNNWYFGEGRFESIEKGAFKFMSRYDSCLQKAMRLHSLAETPTAHEKIDRFIIRINSDCLYVRAKYFGS